MKVWLLYPDRDFDLEQPLPARTEDLVQDLALDVLFQTMAQGDPFLNEVAQRVVLRGLADEGEILYRQAILRDCLHNADIIRQLYQIPLQAIAGKRKQWLGVFGHHPGSILGGARDMLVAYLELLRTLRSIADTHVQHFESAGFRRFFGMIQQELDDDYLTLVADHLETLAFRQGVLLSAGLGKGNEGRDYVLCKPRPGKRRWVPRFMSQRSPEYSFKLHPRDDAGARALNDLRERGLNRAANAVAQAAEHVESFLKMLRLDLAFYISCLNLATALQQLHEPLAFPQPQPVASRRFLCRGLYDAALALTSQGSVVANDIAADGKELIIITGANQGGKSTFLRSVGQAHLLMQCGMFVPAESFAASLHHGLFTHFKREEDASMQSGKLDEELGRMSAIVDQLKPGALILLNESFAATNEHEGSEIARQIVSALLEKGIKVFFVTHLYEFAHTFHERQMENTFFLRAERKADGERTFKLKEGKPLPTSYGADLYVRVFAATEQAPLLLRPRAALD